MPSGAKKRKAAKKKKEKETNTNPSSTTNNPQGDNELKSQDEKGSDGGEGGSPASHDHDHQFNEGSEELEESDPSAAAQPSAAVAKSLEEVPNEIKIDEAEGGKEGVVVIEWDLKSEESCESKDASVVHIESAKESGYGNGNSGGLNDETIARKNSKDEHHSSANETAAFYELVKSIDSLHAKMTSVTQSAPVEEAVNLVAESSADSVKAVTSVSETKDRDTGNALLEKSMGSQVGATDLAMKTNEDKVHPFSAEDVRKSSLEEPKPKEFDNGVSSPVSHSPILESTNVAEHVKLTENPECSENQPRVASAPHMVQKTSWLSCCGIFEVLSGSNS